MKNNLQEQLNLAFDPISDTIIWYLFCYNKMQYYTEICLKPTTLLHKYGNFDILIVVILAIFACKGA